MARVIVNCDDFGLDERTNLAIAEGFEDGIISSTTLMANMPGFKHAQSLIDCGKVPSDAIGMHFNLTEGEPITDGIRSLRKFCSSGNFHGKIRQRPLFSLNTIESRAVRNEFKAQLSRICSLGFQPTHIDSHHHVHTEWAVYQAVRKDLEVFGPKKLRLSRTHGVSFKGFRGTFKAGYKMFFNVKLRLDGFSTTCVLGEFPDFKNSPSDSHLVEVMVHFVAHEGIMYLDGIADSHYLLQAKEFLDGVELINYSQI